MPRPRQDKPLHLITASSSVPQESAAAHAAKLEYAGLGSGRSIAKLIEQRVKSGGKACVRKATLEKWSRQFGWQAFAKQWDADQIAKKQQQQLEAQEKLNESQAKIAIDASMRVWKRMNDLLTIDEPSVKRFLRAVTGEEPWKEDEVPPSFMLQPSHLISYFRIMADLARTASGAATLITQQQHTGKDGSLLTIELVQRLDAETSQALERWRQQRGLPAPGSEEHLA